MADSPPALLPRSRAEIEALIRAFEDASFPLADWHQREHVTMAAWYLLRHPFDEAMQRVRSGIRSYNDRQGITTTKERGYHDTLTIFFVRKIAVFLRAADPARPEEERIADATRAFPDHRLISEYYSRDRLMSWEARLGWVEPDLKPLED